MKIFKWFFRRALGNRSSSYILHVNITTVKTSQAIAPFLWLFSKDIFYHFITSFFLHRFDGTLLESILGNVTEKTTLFGPSSALS